jgi:hypothetical protein
MKTATHSNPCRATVTGATLALAALNILPCRLAAQDTRPTPAPDRPGEVSERRTQFNVPGDTSAPASAAGPSSSFTLRSRTSDGSEARPPAPTEAAPARFEATVYEVRAAEDRIASLDARALEAKAGTAQALTKALAEFGQTKVLYKVDQTVNLFGDRIALTDNEPMVTGPRIRNVGLRIDISASAPASDGKRKVPNTQVVFHLATLDDRSFELEPTARVKPVRIINLRHSEVPRFGQPCVQLNVSAGTGEPAAQATACVVRYVFSETRP